MEHRVIAGMSADDNLFPFAGKCLLHNRYKKVRRGQYQRKKVLVFIRLIIAIFFSGEPCQTLTTICRFDGLIGYFPNE